jgi:uncharacterized protein YoxC
MVKKSVEKQSRLATWPETMTGWIGTPLSIGVHTLFFVGIFALSLVGVSLDQILLILTTVVSLEAIYLAIFIQMSVNKTTKSLAEVEADIDEIQEDVDEIQEDVEDLGEEIEDISEDIDEIQEDVDEDNIGDENTKKTLENIEKQIQKLLSDIETIKK